MPEIGIRPAVDGDFEIARRWLSAAGLPDDDLTPARMPAFLLAANEDSPVGLIGLERFGDVGLMRSLVVDAAVRGKGVGARLVAALEERARSERVAGLWLLTIDADAFFDRLGYAVRPRRDAPAAIRGTSEFSALCPADAVLMEKRLGAG